MTMTMKSTSMFGISFITSINLYVDLKAKLQCSILGYFVTQMRYFKFF